jgi:hypothetical protein
VISPGPMIPTVFGPVRCSNLDDEPVHHVGYKPHPWNWAGWEYAKKGCFEGRWDDPAGDWRAKYVGAAPLGCYLEVLATYRPDPRLKRTSVRSTTIPNTPQPSQVIFTKIGAGRASFAPHGCLGAMPCLATTKHFRPFGSSSFR